MITRLSIFAGLVLSNSAMADDAVVPAGSTDVAAAASAPGTFSMLIPFVAMFAIMYFLMIRPQQKRLKEQTNMLSQLKEGDEVLTASGILGTVKNITDRMVTLEIDQNVKLKVLKTQVAQVLKGGLPEKLA